jgi:hypothetical protein
VFRSPADDQLIDKGEWGVNKEVAEEERSGKK